MMSATQGPAVAGTVGDHDRRADYNQRIRVEQLRSLHRYLPAFVAIHLLVGAALIFALSGVVPRGELFVWGAALAGVLLIRTWLYVSYRRRRGSGAWNRYGRDFVVGSVEPFQTPDNETPESLSCRLGRSPLPRHVDSIHASRASC